MNLLLTNTRYCLSLIHILPESINRRNTSSLSVAGPSVHIIFVFLITKTSFLKILKFPPIYIIRKIKVVSRKYRLKKAGIHYTIIKKRGDTA